MFRVLLLLAQQERNQVANEHKDLRLYIYITTSTSNITRIMSLLRFDDDFFFDNFAHLNRRLRQLENSFFPVLSSESRTSSTVLKSPKIDFKDNGDRYTMVAELPGSSKDDVKIDLDEERHTLKISGEKRVEREENNEEGKYHMRELSYGKFERSIKLPPHVLLDQVKASMNNGLLTIDIPKKEPVKKQEEKSKVRNIQIGSE